MENLNFNRFFVNTKAESSDVYDLRDNTMLLIVDIQPKLMNTMEKGEEGTVRAEALAKSFRTYGMHILATEQYPKGLGRLDDRLLEYVENDYVFDKTLFDACINPVNDYIAKNGISNVVVVGAEAHVCVYQTVRSLRNAGLNVFLVEDAVNSGTDKLKKTAIRAMRDMGTVIVNTEMVLFDLAHDAKDEHFKMIQNMVKELRAR